MKLRALLLGAGLMFSLQANANLLINGSFESPDQPAGTWSVYYGSPAIPGWSAGPQGVELRDANAGTAATGTQFIELDTYQNSWIEQTVATSVGVEYFLNFLYSPRIGVASTSNTIDVLINGSLVASYTGNGGATHVWDLKSVAYTATGASTTIRFVAGGTSDGYGGSLDGVSFDVPEPGSLALIGAALGLLGLSRRRA
ncbi:MAG: DUF642 domain-containing protein [Rhodocyclaceae bacterium]